MTLATSRMTTPLTISAVCRDWRQAAFSEPRLWNSIYLVAVPYKAKIQAELLRDWLSRSGSLPLTIEIDCSGQDGLQWSADTSTEATTLLLAIFPYSTRCTTFRTRLPPSCLLLPPSQCNVPDPEFINLTRLSVVPQMVQDEEDDEEMYVVPLFQHARNLQHVEISEINFEQLTIPWTKVVKVKTNFVELNDCLRILCAAPNVDYCAFEGILNSGGPETPITEPIFLPRLNLLHLDFGEVNSSGDRITPSITAPDLKILEYVTQHGDSFPAQNFVSFIERSQCNLTDLHIANPSMTAADVYQCLIRVSQSLEYLDLQLPSNANQEFVMYTPHQGVLAQAFPRLLYSKFSGPRTVIDPLLHTLISQSQQQP